LADVDVDPLEEDLLEVAVVADVEVSLAAEVVLAEEEATLMKGHRLKLPVRSAPSCVYRD
jgi:hypothetical protein